MFKLFKNNQLGKQFKKSLILYKLLNNSSKNKIKLLFISGLLSTLFLGIVLFSIFPTSSNTNNSKKQTQVIQEETGLESNENNESIAQGQIVQNPIDLLNPIKTFQTSFIDGVSELIFEGIDLFDDYVAFTPNIARNDGQITDASGRTASLNFDRFYRITQTIAWLLLPLIIVITGSALLLNGTGQGILLLKESGKKVLLFLIGMVSIRFFFSVGIDLTNALNKLILTSLVGNSNELSKSLLNALGLTLSNNKLEFSFNVLNTFGELILWIFLFFLLASLLYQFIMRFFYLLLYLILYPIVFVIGLLPGGTVIFKNYIEEVLKTLFVQPIFLIGLALAIQVMNGVDKPVSKIILGLGSITFLNLIPIIISKYSAALWKLGGDSANEYFNVGKLTRMKRKEFSGSYVNPYASYSLGESIVNKPVKEKAPEESKENTNAPKTDYFTSRKDDYK